MPEGTEIALTVEYLEPIINKHITQINYVNNDNIDVCNFLITNIYSKGKFLWFELVDDNGKKIFILNTFGLTGKWCFKKLKNVRIILTIENKFELYYCDQINYGTFKITDDVNMFNKKIIELGRDLLRQPYTKDEFFNKVKQIKSKREIIKILMSQDNKGIGCGIGNYLSCEILYVAKISPYKKFFELSIEEITSLWFAITNVIARFYIKNDTDYIEHLRESAIIDNNNDLRFIKNDNITGKNKNITSALLYDGFLIYSKDYDPYGNEVKKSKIITGRITHWVEKLQK